MDSEAMRFSTQEAVKGKFGRKRFLVSKITPHYPQGVEREYKRVSVSYMNILKSTVAEYIPKIREALETGKYNRDAKDDEPEVKKTPSAISAVTLSSLDKIFDDIAKDITERQGLFNLKRKIEKLSKLNRKLSIREWKRVVKRTLGIDISEDYYRASKFQQLIDMWVEENVNLIKDVPAETLSDMKRIVKEGYMSGASNKSLATRIQERYNVGKYKAQFYARDQTAKLNARITQEQQKDAGVEEYVWKTAGDVRVRDGHQKLNNKRFKYSDPPVVDEKTGRRANPGQDYNCRCVALPVFDLESVVLPWETAAAKETQ